MRKYQSENITAVTGGDFSPDVGASRLIAWFALAAIAGFVLYRFTVIDEAVIIISCAVLASVFAIGDTAVLTGTVHSWIDYRKRVRELKNDVDRNQSARLDALEAELGLLKSGMLTISEEGQMRTIPKWDDVDNEILKYCREHLFKGGELQVHPNGQIAVGVKKYLGRDALERMEVKDWLKVGKGGNYFWHGPDTIQGVGAALK